MIYNPADLTFDEGAHAYFWRGRRVASVTQHLDRLTDWGRVPADVLEAARERGSFVHQMTHLYDDGELDEDALPRIENGRYVGYLAAWKRFLAECEPNWSSIEKMGYSRNFGFAGTWDRAGELHRKYPGKWTIDVKSSQQAHRVWGLQTAAYRQIRCEIEDPRVALERRATVQLHPNGRYTFLEWTEASDWPVFQALITVVRWSDQQ